jgi:hypothetical protein
MSAFPNVKNCYAIPALPVFKNCHAMPAFPIFRNCYAMPAFPIITFGSQLIHVFARELFPFLV